MSSGETGLLILPYLDIVLELKMARANAGPLSGDCDDAVGAWKTSLIRRVRRSTKKRKGRESGTPSNELEDLKKQQFELLSRV